MPTSSDVIVIGGTLLLLFVLLRWLGGVWRSRLLVFLIVGTLGGTCAIGGYFLYEYWKTMNRQPLYDHGWEEDGMEDLNGNPIDPKQYKSPVEDAS